jgi:DnaJ domain
MTPPETWETVESTDTADDPTPTRPDGEAARAFPGGTTRLPRISHPRTDGPDATFVDSAFYREPSEPWPASSALADTGFGQYYSTQSLFDSVPELFVEPDREDGPYTVLGLTRRADWEEISKAHRRLVSELHPDRYVDADDVVRDAAERRVRDVNEAYAEIRRDRAAGQAR